MQKMCCPCCFGRECLVLNQGVSCANTRVVNDTPMVSYPHQYLSEAGASIVDQNLNLNVVPKTKVVHLASASFYYGNINRYRAQIAHDLAERFPEIGKHMRQGLPPKVGSLQMFVRGYKVYI